MVFNFLPWLLDKYSRPEYALKKSDANNACVVFQDLDLTICLETTLGHFRFGFNFYGQPNLMKYLLSLFCDAVSYP